MYICQCFAHVYVCSLCACLVPVKGRSIRSPGSEVTGDCEMPCWCWESNMFPPQEHVLLSAQPSFQPQVSSNFNKRHFNFLLCIFSSYSLALPAFHTKVPRGPVTEKPELL